MKIDEFFIEEEFHKKKRKETKKIRKIKEKKDRSKYKKTDQNKLQEKKQIREDLLSGRVLSIRGEGSIVLANKKEYLCTLSGVLKKRKTKDKNLIAVGDIVYFLEEKKNEGSIKDVEKRTSILVREDKRQKQIIAANIDQVFIVSSVIKPYLKPSLIDRYIIAAEKGNITPIVVINKIDLLKSNEFTINEIEEEEKRLQSFLKDYKNLGYDVYLVSAKKKNGIKKLLKAMKNKASVFSGQSGIGKSSLINAILKTNLKTGEVVKKTYKGAHITTRATLLPLKEGGFCIDTPGIKSFGLFNITKEDIKNHFSDFFIFAKDCKYRSCDHLDEPSCKVKEAVLENKLSSLRYESYKNLIEEIKEK